MTTAADGPRPAKTIRIGFVLYPKATLIDFAGATQVFAFARGPDVEYQTFWLGPTKDAAIPTTEGVSVLTNESFGTVPALDLLFIPGGGADGVEFAMFDPTYQAFIKQVAATGVWVGSVCVGAFILAAARQLDGCRATTYWSQLPNLALLERPMGIRVEPGFPRFAIEEQRKRFTGGGASSSLDLALELVTRVGGKAVAEAAQLSIQYAPHPPTHTGDPSQAPPPLTNAVRGEQLAGFITPIRRAVERLIGP